MGRGKKGKDEWRKQRRNREGSVYEYKGKIYARIQFIGEDGTRKDKKILANSRKDARDLVKKLRGDLDSHGEVVLDAQRMTFGDLAAVYEKQRLVPALIVDGRKVAGLRSSYSAKRLLIPLVAHFGRKHVRKITHPDLEGYKLIRLQTPVIIKKRPADSAELKSTGRRSSKKAKGKSKTQETISRQRSLSAVNRELELLRTIFNFAEHNDWVVKSPFKRGASLISKASERQRDRILTREEETRLLAACNGKRAHLRGLLICALDTAMRRGELFKLKWPDVDFPANLIRIRATNTKTERARTVGMTPRVADALTALRNQAPPNYSGSVFGISDTVKTAWKSALSEAKIAEFRMHDCRHTAITRMIQAGMPAAEVMKISGHTQWTTFSRYVNLNEEAARRGAELLSAYLDRSGAREGATVQVSGAVN